MCLTKDPLTCLEASSADADSNLLNLVCNYNFFFLFLNNVISDRINYMVLLYIPLQGKLCRSLQETWIIV